MKARLLGAGAALLAFLAGAPWWAALLGAVLFQVPGRIAPLLGTVAVVALLDPATGPWWRDLLCLACGILAGLACLARLARTLPWVALPYVAGGVVLLSLLWARLPPAPEHAFWTGTDLSVRARIAVLAALMLVASSLRYLPRYRNVPSPPPVPAPPGPPLPPLPPLPGPPKVPGGGTDGAREASR